MIRLDLGTEPASLAKTREGRVRVVAALYAEAGPVNRKTVSAAITGYSTKETRKALHDRQHGKCAWCERPVGPNGNPVEHVRPKLGADHKDGTRDPDHYWWLAWTWTNLVYACAHCNSQANKGNKYWLMPGSSRLQAPAIPITGPLPEFDLSGEQPFLVHPRLEDPLDFIRWVPADRNLPKARWRWVVLGNDPDMRGAETIAMLGLRQVEDSVNAHLRATVLQKYMEISAHVTQGRHVEATDAWTRMLSTHVNDASQPFRAASWWAIDSLWPRAERTRCGFADPERPVVS